MKKVLKKRNLNNSSIQAYACTCSCSNACSCNCGGDGMTAVNRSSNMSDNGMETGTTSGNLTRTLG